MLRIIALLTPTTLILCACSSAAAPSNQDAQLTTPPAAKVYEPTETDLRAAQAVLKELARGAEDYFTSEQKYVTAEPWHPIPEPDEDVSAYEGFPIKWEQYTFPGGANFTMSSHPEPPQGGEPVMPSPSASSDFMPAVLDKLSFTWPNYPTRFKYTYTVGDKLADQSTLTIMAQANFDTSNDALYTMTVRVDIDEQNKEVVVHPIETMPEANQ